MLENQVRARAFHWTAPWMFAVAVAIMPFAASAQSPLPGGVQSLTSGEASPAKRATAAAPKEVDLSALPQITAKELAAVAALPPLPRPKTLHTDQQYAAFKAAAAQKRFDFTNLKPASGQQPNAPGGSASASAGSEGVLTPAASLAFVGDTETEACSGLIPSDMGLAVGDTNVGVLQVTNACVSVYNKSGVRQAGFPKSLRGFFGANLSGFIFDPRALYDWANHRYIVSAVEYDATDGLGFNIGSYWIAVSAADNPAGVYHIYRLFSFFGFANFLDFPRLGQDRQAVYLASNVFPNAGGFAGEEWNLLPKAAMYAGNGFSYNIIPNPFGAFLDSTQPANVFSNTDNPRAEFFVSSLNAPGGFYDSCLFSTGCNGLFVWAVSDPLGTAGGPELSVVFLPTTFNYFFPSHALDPGNDPIDTGDARISGEVTYGAGFLYASVTTLDGLGHTGNLLYKIAPVLNVNNGARCPSNTVCPDITSAAMIEENFLDFGGGWSSYATQQPDPEGNVTTVANFTGPFTFAETYFISSRATQGVGAFNFNFVDTGQILMSGFNNYTQSRWGDYTAVAAAGIGGSTPSPTFWFAGMFVDSSGFWETEIGRNGFTSPAQP